MLAIATCVLLVRAAPSLAFFGATIISLVVFSLTPNPAATPRLSSLLPKGPLECGLVAGVGFLTTAALAVGVLLHPKNIDDL